MLSVNFSQTEKNCPKLTRLIYRDRTASLIPVVCIKFLNVNFLTPLPVMVGDILELGVGVMPLTEREVAAASVTVIVLYRTSLGAIHRIVLIVVCVMWAFHAGFVTIL